MTDSKHDERHDGVWLLLPWYANGTLETAERQLVEDHLAGCPGCRDELARCNGFAAALRARPEIAPSPHPLQLARLMERLDAPDEIDAIGEIDAIDEIDAIGETDAIDGIGTTGAVCAAGAVSATGPIGPIGASDAAEAGAAGDLHAADGADGASDARDARTARATRTPRQPSHGSTATVAGARGRQRGASLLGGTPRPVRWALAGQLAALILLAAALAVGPARRFETGPPAPQAAARPAPPARARFVTLSAPAPLVTSAAPQIRVVFAETATEKQMRQVLLSIRGRLVDGPSPLGAYTLELPAPAPAATAPPAGASRGAGTGDAAATTPAPRAALAEAAPDSVGIVLAYLHAQRIVHFAEPVAGTGTPAASPPAVAVPQAGTPGTAPEAPRP
jgi:Putative zinc-finger